MRRPRRDRAIPASIQPDNLTADCGALTVAVHLPRSAGPSWRYEPRRDFAAWVTPEALALFPSKER